MATVSTLELTSWPFEYKGWRITFEATGPDVPNTEPHIVVWKVEHLHEDEQQLVKWTKKRKKPDLKNIQAWYAEGDKEQLCCFVCAVYMPDSVYDYFEKCKEMTRCSNL